MKTRAITGFFFVIVMLASVLTGAATFYILYLLLSLGCLYEFYGLIDHAGHRPNRTFGLLTGAFVFLTVVALNRGNDVLGGISPKIFVKLALLIPVLVSAVWISELYKKSAAPFANVGYTFLGIMFVIFPFAFFHALAYVGLSFNFHLPLGFLVMLWANDTGAYLTGRAIGKRKLFERHSPKKTWEGFFGGLIIAGVAGFILSIYYTELALQHWLVMAAIISCFGTLGDLVESMFKRSIDVKDSGKLLPGHGGLLDRFDGLLLAAPIVYTYLYFVTN